jgi:hypothetical protein
MLIQINDDELKNNSLAGGQVLEMALRFETIPRSVIRSNADKLTKIELYGKKNIAKAIKTIKKYIAC